MKKNGKTRSTECKKKLVRNKTITEVNFFTRKERLRVSTETKL